MNTLGDHRWLNQYIGIPYKFGGRDFDGVDCYGLVSLIYQDRYGIQLPDWERDEINLKDITTRIERVVTSGDFIVTKIPTDGNFAVCARMKAAHHIGLYYAGGIIHCLDGIGSVYEPRARFEFEFNNVQYGEWVI